MNAIVEEWVSKAEGDWRTANREIRVRKGPNYDAVCFHTQQCAEKYLKAYLQAENILFPKSHNLIELLDLSGSSAIELHRDILEQLNRYAVLIRYPGEEADKAEARRAIKRLKTFREFMRQLLKV